MEQFKRFLKVVIGAVIIWFVLFNVIAVHLNLNPIGIMSGTVLVFIIPFIFITFSGIIGDVVWWGVSWVFTIDNWVDRTHKSKKKFPCEFDHNGECLVCDCSFEHCGYDRWVKGDYTYENETELDKMFEGYKKIKTYTDDTNS